MQKVKLNLANKLEQERREGKQEGKDEVQQKVALSIVGGVAAVGLIYYVFIRDKKER